MNSGIVYLDKHPSGEFYIGGNCPEKDCQAPIFVYLTRRRGEPGSPTPWVTCTHPIPEGLSLTWPQYESIVDEKHALQALLSMYGLNVGNLAKALMRIDELTRKLQEYASEGALCTSCLSSTSGRADDE